MAAAKKRGRRARSDTPISQAQRRHEENVFTARMLGVFGAIILSVVALWRLEAAFEKNSAGVGRWLLFAGAPLFAAGIFLCFFYLLRSGLSRRTPHAVAASGIAALAAGGACLLIRYGGTGVFSVLYIALPAAAVLYLIFYLYQRDFFLLSLFVSLQAAGLWVLSKDMRAPFPPFPLWAALVVFCGALALSLIALLLLRMWRGRLRIGGAHWEILPYGAKYRFLFIACGLGAAIVAASVFFGWQAAWYGVFGMFGFLFIAAVYYTVKSM